MVSFVFILFGTCRASLNLWAGGFQWFWKVLDRYFSKRSFVPFSLSSGATISLNGLGLLPPSPAPPVCFSQDISSTLSLSSITQNSAIAKMLLNPSIDCLISDIFHF